MVNSYAKSCLSVLFVFFYHGLNFASLRYYSRRNAFSFHLYLSISIQVNLYRYLYLSIYLFLSLCMHYYLYSFLFFFFLQDVQNILPDWVFFLESRYSMKARQSEERVSVMLRLSSNSTHVHVWSIILLSLGSFNQKSLFFEL